VTIQTDQSVKQKHHSLSASTNFQDEGDKEKFNIVLKIEDKLQKVTNFFRYYEIYLTMYQLPSFFSRYKGKKC
jgi:hypothetical protein